MKTLYPLRFTPVYKNYIWGGKRLESVFRRKLDPRLIYAESWEVSDHPHGQSLVEHGPLQGISLNRLVTEHGQALLGRHHPRSRFPLLLKYLDAHRRLSVQVHPDDQLAMRMGLTDPGKTEAWLVVEAAAGSPIWAGFNRPVDRDTLSAVIRQGELQRWLHRIEPQPGDCLFLPAGTVHALGEGLLVAEIQQASDSTFRLFDWNRTGQDGKPRALQIDQALQAIDYGQGRLKLQTPHPTGRDYVQRLVQCEQFILDRWTLDTPQTAGGDDRCHIITVIRGSVAIQGDAAPGALQRGQTILLPATAGSAVISPQFGEGATLLDAYIP